MRSFTRPMSRTGTAASCFFQPCSASTPSCASFADGGYQGPLFEQAVAKRMTQMEVAIVKRWDTAKGFVVLPRRWVVERSFALCCENSAMLD
jgi:hypothetical protein